MEAIIKQRMCAEMDGDFVVFLIGMRVNNWWKILKWWPIAMAMPRMLKELGKNKEIGYLGGIAPGFSNPTVLIQYWRSFEHLEKFARDPDATHFPAWKKFNQLIRKNGEVGVWHETYLVKAGNYETIYNNMPAFGLGAASKLIAASGHHETARGRLTGN
jgi:hypothetical protein